VLPWLPPDWHVVSMTQRGHGGSSAATSYRTRDFAADAATLVATLRLPPVVVVGHSMGAVNALRMAIDHPTAVRGVVAAGGFASFSDKPAFVDFVQSQMLTLGERVPRELAESFQRDTVAGPVAPGLLETMVDECLRAPAATWRGAFAALLEDDFSAELHTIEASVLLPWGDADAFSPESDQQRLERQLPQATRAVYAGVGHALHWERPRRFAADLIRFEQTLAMPS
jgi:pimeloyl-ACP methyl ester carboxylesterase